MLASYIHWCSLVQGFGYLIEVVEGAIVLSGDFVPAAAAAPAAGHSVLGNIRTHMAVGPKAVPTGSVVLQGSADVTGSIPEVIAPFQLGIHSSTVVVGVAAAVAAVALWEGQLGTYSELIVVAAL